ncbi:LPS biosynthesis protein [bacterium]|nr:LPS biosynthesis protein [bacterium]
MKTCKKCLYSSIHPLNITFDENMICSGCRVHQEKDIIDWKRKDEELRNLLKVYKSKSGKNYDCIIPISGASDSYFIVHKIKNIYGMNPLLVTYNKQYNTKIGIRNLANLKNLFDVDILTLTVNPNIVKKITRHTLRLRGSIYWHCLAGQTVFPVQVATRLKIPLIVWGAHQGVDQVGMFSHLDSVEMTRKYRKEHDLMGLEAEDLIDEIDCIDEDDISQYLYPDDIEIQQIGVRGIYLNNYIRWDSRKQHEEMIKLYDYATTLQNRTFDTYNNTDCWNYNDLHDYIKFIKYGYGKVIDHCSRDIRLNHITRTEAKKLVETYIYKKPKYSNLFFEWLGITENGFNHIMDQFRNPEFWIRDENWEWKLNPNSVLNEQIISNQKTNYASEYILTGDKYTNDNSGKYIIIGKGC